MKPSAFWKLVEKHPLLLGIFSDLWTDFPHSGFELLVCYLYPAAIRDLIGYIAFRPWRSLQLDATTALDSTGIDTIVSEEVKQTTTLGRTVWHLCLWSIPGNRKTCWQGAKCTSNQEDLNLTVRAMIEQIVADGGRLDAVVKVTKTEISDELSLRGAVTDENEGLRLSLMLNNYTSGNDRFSHNYDVYLPPTDGSPLLYSRL